MQSIFNAILKNNIYVKDQNNILKSIFLLNPVNSEIKIKFEKYVLMEDKSFYYKDKCIYSDYNKCIYLGGIMYKLKN